MELKEKKTGTKALGAALVSNLNPAFNQPTNEYNTTLLSQGDTGRVFSHSDLANLTLHQVAREGDVMLMEKLLERLSSPAQRKKRLNSKDESKLTPMHYAARYNHYHMIDYLIKNGAHVQIKGEDDATPLHYIAKYKKRKAVEAKAANEEDGDSSSDEEELPPEESFSCLKLLVENGAQVNPRDSMGLTPLHQACTRGNTSVVRELLECNGLALEMTDHQGMTAFHLSCLYGRKKIVKMLLEAGSNLRCRDKDMTTPFHLACAEGSIEIATCLLEKADSLATSTEDPPFYMTVDEGKSNKGGEGKAHNRKPSNGVQKQNKIINPVKQIERMATSGSLTNKESNHTQNMGGSGEMLQDVDGDKNLPLHLAIENGHFNLVKLCIERSKVAGLGSMVRICRSRDDSCLHLAVQSNSLEIVKFLVDEGADVNARNSSLTTPLLLSCQHNSHNIVKYLLDKGANIEMKDCDFMTPLIIASRYGHLESISWLLEYNADITETDKDDKNCLMWAAEEDQTDAINLLLRKRKMRMMIEERDRYNNTALHLASTKGHTDTVKLLLDHKAAADIKNDVDRTTLHMAALHGHDVIIPDLVARDRSIVNSSDEEANTALHLAAIGGNLKCVGVLIQAGANIELRNARQWTPLDCAAAYGWEKVAKALLEAGASIQPKGKIKVAPLHLACQRGHVDVVKLLLAWKADVTFRAADGRNALDFAIDFSQKDCVLALIKHETWKQSMRNAVINSVTGQMMTPMRKLIMKMEDMALIVCNQCVTDNGKKPENDDYAVTLLYELLDDMYASTEWLERIEERPKSSGGQHAYETVPLVSEDNPYTVYDEHDQLTPEANTYSKKSDELQENHPLQIMVRSKCENLLLHPVVTGLLNYKWKRYGRYVYYSNLLLYIAYLIVLNVYMLLIPPFYQLDWNKMVEFQRYLMQGGNESGLNISSENLNLYQNASPSCWFYRSEVYEDPPYDNMLTKDCHTLDISVRNLKWALFGFSIFNLAREAFQLINQKLSYIDFTNAVEVALYVLSLILSTEFEFTIESIVKLSGGQLSASDNQYLVQLQRDTGLRTHLEGRKEFFGQEWQQEIGAFAIFLSWMGLLLFIQKIPRLGIFVVMFTDILKTFGEFFLVFAFFILGFSLSFTILLGNQFEFEKWYEALVKTTVMMIGELDYSNIFYQAAQESEFNYHAEVYAREVSIVLFVIFLVVMTIIIMNLLVGLAVGDIIEVQQHATLERLGMQVALALEVEFTLPGYLRKKMCLRKQMVEINKYRKSNFIKKFLLGNSNLTLETITKALDMEAVDQEEARTAEDKVLSGLYVLRGRIADILADQAEVKQGMRGVRALVREAQNESRIHASTIKENISHTSSSLSSRIDTTHTGLTETTRHESSETRDRVDGTITKVNQLQEEVESTKMQLGQAKAELERKMEVMQEKLLARSWKEMEARLQACNDQIEKSKSEILENLEEMKIVLVKERYMSRV